MSKPSVNFNQFRGAAPARAACRPGPAPPRTRDCTGQGRRRGPVAGGAGGDAAWQCSGDDVAISAENPGRPGGPGPARPVEARLRRRRRAGGGGDGSGWKEEAVGEERRGVGGGMGGRVGEGG